VPVTVSVVESGVELVVTIVKIDVPTLPAGATEAGLKVHVVAAGHSTVKATAWLNPSNSVTVIVETADEPLFTGEGARGVDPRVKSCPTAREPLPHRKPTNSRTITRPITFLLCLGIIRSPQHRLTDTRPFNPRRF
jgi:hypothetical protein